MYCSGCKTDKPIESFSKNRAMKSGRANWCKDCHRALYTSEEYLARRIARRDASIERSMLIEVRARAKKRGLAFDLELADIVIPSRCPVLGLTLERHRGALKNNTPTMDRINPAHGYVKGNIAIISWRANRLKSDCGDPAIFEAIAAYMRRHCVGQSDNAGLQAA